jgi:hypothetical protein
MENFDFVVWAMQFLGASKELMCFVFILALWTLCNTYLTITNGIVLDRVRKKLNCENH